MYLFLEHIRATSSLDIYSKFSIVRNNLEAFQIDPQKTSDYEISFKCFKGTDSFQFILIFVYATSRIASVNLTPTNSNFDQEILGTNPNFWESFQIF